MHRAERYKGGKGGMGKGGMGKGRGEEGKEVLIDGWNKACFKRILCPIPRWHRMSYEVLEARTLLAPPGRSTPTPALTCNPPFPSNRFWNYSLLPERNVYQFQ